MEDSRQYQRAEDWVSQLLAKGKYAFALYQFRADFPGRSDIANKFALKRLIDKKQIISCSDYRPESWMVKVPLYAIETLGLLAEDTPVA